MSLSTPDDYFELGRVLNERGQWGEAADAWRAAMVAGDPDVAAIAALNLGTLLHRLEDQDGADEAWQIALDHGVEEVSSRAGIALASLRQESEDFPGAARALRAVLSLEDRPHIATAALNLGVVEQRLGEVDEAEESFRLAIMAAENSEPVRSMAMHNLGVLATDEERFSDAEEAFIEVIEWGDADLAPKAKLDLGTMYARSGRPDEARSTWKEVVDSGHPAVAPTASDNLAVLDS